MAIQNTFSEAPFTPPPKSSGLHDVSQSSSIINVWAGGLSPAWALLPKELCLRPLQAVIVGSTLRPKPLGHDVAPCCNPAIFRAKSWPRIVCSEATQEGDVDSLQRLRLCINLCINDSNLTEATVSMNLWVLGPWSLCNS